jgi:hypothetical protein
MAVNAFDVYDTYVMMFLLISKIVIAYYECLWHVSFIARSWNACTSYIRPRSIPPWSLFYYRLRERDNRGRISVRIDTSSPARARKGRRRLYKPPLRRNWWNQRLRCNGMSIKVDFGERLSRNLCSLTILMSGFSLSLLLVRVCL